MALPTTFPAVSSGPKGPNPADSMPAGAHSSLAKASKHKKMVSGVLHLKKESLGKRTAPTGYVRQAKAFVQVKPKKVTNG